MINVDMTVREAISLIETIGDIPLRDRLIKAIEVAAGDANTSLTLHTIPESRYIRVIQTVRLGMGWGLKECKEWADVVRGKMIQTPVRTENYEPWGVATHYETTYEGGRPNTLSASSKTINDMVLQMRELGCEVTTG